MRRLQLVTGLLILLAAAALPFQHVIDPGLAAALGVVGLVLIVTSGRGARDGAHAEPHRGPHDDRRGGLSDESSHPPHVGPGGG